jgi:hypothetical protein
MQKFSKHKWWILTALLTAPLIAMAANVPNIFSPNTVISSSQVNDNFANLANRVTALETTGQSVPVVRTSAETTIPAGQYASAIASCDTGEILTGGGCSYIVYSGTTGDQNPVASGPFLGVSGVAFPASYAVNSATGGNSWTCVYEETQGLDGNTFQAFAVCSTR